MIRTKKQVTRRMINGAFAMACMMEANRLSRNILESWYSRQDAQTASAVAQALARTARNYKEAVHREGGPVWPNRTCRKAGEMMLRKELKVQWWLKG